MGRGAGAVARPAGAGSGMGQRPVPGDGGPPSRQGGQGGLTPLASPHCRLWVTMCVLACIVAPDGRKVKGIRWGG